MLTAGGITLTGAELSAKQKKVKWEAEEDDKDEMDDIFTEKTLELRQVRGKSFHFLMRQYLSTSMLATTLGYSI